jgi:hypothetical protein
MTRDEILKAYEVVDGIIRSPGKFEGEPVYVPAFWEDVLEGFADEEGEDEDGTVISTIVVDEDDVKAFPELKDIRRVSLWEDSQGFVRSVLTDA